MTQEWKNAVCFGRIDVLQRLFAAGADIDARDEHGQSALMLAAVGGREPVVKWLVERDPRPPSDTAGHDLQGPEAAHAHSLRTKLLVEKLVGAAIVHVVTHGRADGFP